MGVIIYNGRSSKDYHIQVETPPGYDIPKRDIEYVHIPGRNGDVLFDRGSYENIDRSYEISFGDPNLQFQDMANNLSVWLHSTNTYAKLEDSYDPQHYRMAIYLNDLSVENILSHGGKAEIVFSCKPNRYLKSGDQVTTFTSSGHLKNPTEFDSLPILKIYGTGAGTVNIGDYRVSASSIGGELIIDSYIQDAYGFDGSKNLVNKNSVITLNGSFPKFKKNSLSTVSFTGGVTKVEVTPRWWTL